jgi:hypothetical protein
MNKTLIYLAAPYSHQDRSVLLERVDIINRVPARLMGQGLHIYSPISHTHPIAEAGDLPKGWDYWKGYDYAIMNCCAKVVVLQIPGWLESRGVQAEIKIAEELNLPVEYIEP